MKLKKNSSKQKLRGAYYTPSQLANALVNIVAPENISTVLEPSCGDGVFIDSLKELGFIENITSLDAVEIESDEALKVQKNYQNTHNVHVFNEDFFEFYNRTLNNKQYDLILGNPPYIRYQYLSESQRKFQSNILTSHGMKANKLINAWVAFLVASVQLLSENGKIAFVIPAEILQVAYAEDLRFFLSEHLAKISLITFEQLVFPNIEQEVVLFIGEKDTEKKGIRIIEMNDLSGFDTLDPQQNGFQKMQHVKEKWTKYFMTAKEMELIQAIRSDTRFTKFADYGLINVGITTGNNDYFSITENTCEKYDLEKVTLPLIGRSSHAHGIFFTDTDWEKNKALGKRARLINFSDSPIEKYPTKHQEYIAFGESSGENDGYKCSIRDRWYIVPSIWVPDAFFLRRSNLYPKFVLNHCNAVSTDTMHRMKFNFGVNPENILLAYYNSISFAFTEICGRSYGGGVLEILPGEMGNIMIPRIDSISEEIRANLLNRVDAIVRKDADIERALDLVDKEVLVDLLGIDAEWCNQCRSIWKKMQKRRLGRG
ncbi:Eco57I restriction-modification methylase domain-containing protein [Akkermansia sp.]|uniref:Eco57I restriction-modification methylase domain-containing protein n=1 Tax=Akkermansia sp. TaxID=1872421 RepID=UPI003A92D2A5